MPTTGPYFISIPIPKHPSKPRQVRFVGHCFHEGRHVLVEPRDVIDIALMEIEDSDLEEGLELLSLLEDPFFRGEVGVDPCQKGHGRHRRLWKGPLARWGGY